MVSTEDLANVIEPWLEREEGDTFAGILSGKSILYVKGVNPHRLAEILRRQKEYTRLEIADRILVAAGLEHRFYDGTLEIFSARHTRGGRLAPVKK